MNKATTRRSFLKAAGAAAASGLLSRAARAGPPAGRPNIVLFLVDDQRDDTLGCAGHPIIKTPVVDGLAAGGVRFRNAFVTTSICAASRASILTGLHERTHGYTFGKRPITKEHAEASYPALLRKAGYRTGFIGKFGVKIARGARNSTIRSKEPDLRAQSPQSSSGLAMFDYFRQLGRSPYFKKQADGSLRHETELAGDRAIEFLRANPQEKPFCLSVSFNAVHAEDRDKKDHFPWPKAVDGMYEDVEIPPPRLSDPAIFRGHPDFLKKSMNRQRFFWRWDTPEKYQRNMRAYFRMISGVDRVIGRVVDEIEKRGLARNTVVIYAGDNGYYMGNRGFAGKWSHYEESLRVPLIVHDPRLPEGDRGKVRDEMALNIDIPATMLALAGVGVPGHYQGGSLVPLVRGTAPAGWRRDFFCEHLMKHGAIPMWEGVRGERYVYARYFAEEPVYEFLHDLEADPDELTNFIADPFYAAALARMRRRCDELRDAYGGAVRAAPAKAPRPRR